MATHSVIFDMDGLLLDTEKVCLDSFVETRQSFSLSDAQDIFLRCVGLRSAETDQIIQESLNDQVGLQAFNIEWDRRIAARLSHRVPLKKGAAQLVRILASKGYLMGVATSTQTAQACSNLERSGLLPYFKSVIGGDLVKKGKPDPEVYHRVAGCLGVMASECTAFEDSETGTRAAVASGARTVQIPDLIQPSAGFALHGQFIAPSLLEGAEMAGLITSEDIKGFTG